MNRYILVRTLVVATAVAAGAWSQETVNPHFDTDLGGWSVFSAPNHQWSPVDSSGDAASGTLLALKDFAGGALVRATQCVAVAPGTTLHFSVRVFVLESGGAADVTIDLTPCSDASCLTPVDLNRVIETPEKGQWATIVHGPHVVPEGVHSIEVGLGIAEAWLETPPLSAHFDNAEFFVLADGFEDGTCARWSGSIPFCATPGEGLRVELEWATPGDPDETDVVGADLDLHLLHPDGAGEWLGAEDCFAGNPSPDWGEPGAAGDPDLVISDLDGAGPEAIQVTAPESVEYDVGVHYVDDSDFGNSTATVTVFVDGMPVYQYSDKALADGEFWHLGSVQWPGGSVTVTDTVTAGVP